MLWRDPRTGIYVLRKRIPQRYRAVSGRRGETVKITTGTTDKKEAERLLPTVLSKYQEMESDWERKLNRVALTPEKANEVAASWAAWISAGAPLETGGENSDIFDEYALGSAIDSKKQEVARRIQQRVEVHADEALRLVNISATPETYPRLLKAMGPVVANAYLQADLRSQGISGKAASPLEAVRRTLPEVATPPLPSDSTNKPYVSLDQILRSWKAVTTTKPATIRETEYAFGMLKAFLGHDDAGRVTTDDLRRWRDQSKAGGLTNNTWNNRLSMLRQPFALAYKDGVLPHNPADQSLRLRKNKKAVQLPYSDEDAIKILSAARSESKPTLRWAHWVMAFTGMRVGEVLQLDREDIGKDGDIWFISVNEDTEGKSVKTGQRRNVPIHPALIAEGFLEYVSNLPEGSPVFPDKKPDSLGRRGGRGWNVVGRWVRRKVGITDKRKQPDHAWRHRLLDELRAAEVYEADRDAIVGHARKTTGGQYGVRGEALKRLYRKLSKVRSPIPPERNLDRPADSPQASLTKE